MSSSQPKRSQRQVEQDAAIALGRMYQAASSAIWCAIIFAAFALWIAYDEQEWRLGAGAAAIVAAILGLAFWVRRGSQLAAVGLVAVYAGAVAFVWMSTGQISGALGLAFLGYRLWQGMLGSFDLAELRKEFAAVYEPRGIQPGDLYSVEQSGKYAVVKVLAFDPAAPDLVHLRLYGRRYRERPQAIGGGAERDRDPTVQESSGGQRTAYPHLPVRVSDFVSWLPALLRHEPVESSELAGYDAWRRVQYPRSRTADEQSPPAVA